MFDNFKISTRLMMLTSSLLVLLTIVGFMGLRGVSGTSEGLRSVYESNTVPLVQLGEVLDVVYQSRANVITGMSADSSSAADVHFQAVEKVNEQLNRIWGDYRAAVVSAEVKEQAANFEQAWKDYAESGNKTVALARSGDYETASSFMKAESAKKFAAARDALLNLMRYEKETARDSFEKTSRSNTTTRTLVLITLLLGLAIGAGQSYGTIHSIASRLNLMQTTIGEIEHSSDYSKRVPITSRDELGQTAKSFNELMGVLQWETEEQKALIRKLEEAHNQLLQSEKMASIGQLAAGVAHEINNPIGYVNSNLGSLEKYIETLFRVLAACERAECELGDQPILEEIRSLKREADWEFIKQDILELLKESTDGIARVKRIVQDLKDFSHVDEAEWQWVDLHSGIDSTLNVVHNEIKYNAEVVKEYGELPQVECLAHQLNQVFMNVLVNASHAIGPDGHGRITIRSGTKDDKVWVEISDNGNGIAPENLKRIFDPFFTTKPVGKGTGLGLSLSYGIVEKHHGKIEVESEVGKGTTFRIWLPVRQAAG
ncbi:MAG: MCP four helix bundle domain-containing protein [Sulfuricella sp.]